jgi:hypothetical protein
VHYLNVAVSASGSEIKKEWVLPPFYLRLLAVIFGY